MVYSLLNSALGIQSVFSPILMVAIAAIIFILFFLYKTSELMDKKKLIIFITISILVFIALSFINYQKSKLPKINVKLSILPVLHDYSGDEWKADAVLDVISKNLSRFSDDKNIIAPSIWFENVVPKDSLSDFNYVIQLNKELGSTHFLMSETCPQHGSELLKMKLYSIKNNTEIFNSEYNLNIENLDSICTQITRNILASLNIVAAVNENEVKLVQPDVYKNYMESMSSFENGNYRQAAKLAENVIKLDSSLVPAYLQTGKSWFMQALALKKKGGNPVEEFEKARTWLTRTVSLDSLNSEAYAYLGEYYIYRERWSVAEGMLMKSFRLNPNFPRLYLSLSRLHKFRYEKLGFNNEEALFRHAIFINPAYEEAYMMLSDYLLFENKRKKAIEVLDKYLEINPNSVPVLMALGKIYLVRNEILKIIEVFNKVIELDPNNADAFYNLGILYYNSEDFDTAEKFLLRAIAINNHLNANLYLAYLYEVKGDYDKAVEYLRRRIHYRTGLEDEFAEEARKHLFKLVHRDSLKVDE